MKKNLGILSALAAAFALCFALVGCGGTSDEPDASTFAGTYEITAMVSDGEEASTEDLELMKSFGMEVNLDLNEDMTMDIDLFGEKIEGTWEIKSATELAVTMEGQTVTATVDGDNITLEQDGSTLTFTKKAESEAEATAEAAAAVESEAAAAVESEVAAAESEAAAALESEAAESEATESESESE